MISRKSSPQSSPEDVSAASPLGILGFGTGLAIVAHILSGISLAATLGLVLVATAVAGRYFWAHTSTERREGARRRLRTGALAGIAALVAYDLSRWSLVQVLHFQFRPFESFTGFGRALWGAGADGWWVDASGVALHIANGLAFAIGYTLLAGHRGPIAGIAFAILLEAVMVALYPSWLRIQAIDEFLQVSMLGHVAYGATLGWASQALLKRSVSGPSAHGN